MPSQTDNPMITPRKPTAAQLAAARVVSAYHGAKGGAKKSPAKTESCRKNAAKRWANRDAKPAK